MSEMKKQPKTAGLEWLIHSLSSFNGSGYADMDSPEAFLESYSSYKGMKKQSDAVRLAQIYKPEAIIVLRELLDRTYGASRYPSQDRFVEFESYKNNRDNHWL